MARKLAPDKWLFAATIGLALFGVVMVYSASAVMAARENGNQFFYVLKQGVWVAIGFGVMLLMMQFNYQQLKRRHIVYGLLLVTILALFAVFGFSSSNGAHRWIKLPGVSLQPSEVSKVALIIFLAYFLEKRAGEEGDLWRTFIPCGAITAFLAGLVVIEPDLGTALMLAVIFVVMIYT
ncbi:MAG TPA: FtsW/RodA/SpoVE family cell cycle protein, partial [Pyrinomonadaceae bacterium]|nr:FtsW/RodA/SpoVE family cell cycle protein [Pyrinomonadaceae bacterium]